MEKKLFLSFGEHSHLCAHGLTWWKRVPRSGAFHLGIHWIFFFYRVLSVVMEGFVSPPTQLPCALEAFNWLCQAASGIWIYQLSLFLCKQGDLQNIAEVLQMQKARNCLWLWVVKAPRVVHEWDGAVGSWTCPGTSATATAGARHVGL